MKKIVSALFVSTLFFLLSACEKDPLSNDNTATVTVKVVNLLDKPVKGAPVYLFIDNVPTASTKPGEAKKKVVSNENGIASFKLDLNGLHISERTQLYFATYYKIVSTTLISVSSAITVQNGDAVNVGLAIP